MKRCLLMLLIYWSSQSLYAQKAVINSSSYDKWPVLKDRPSISNDAKFIAYGITVGADKEKKNNYIIQSTESDWKMEIPERVKIFPTFTSDSKYNIFINSRDSLVIVNLINKKIRYISNVSDFKMPNNGSGEWFVYLLNNEQKKMVAENLRSGEQRVFSGVHWLQFADDGKVMVLQRSFRVGNKENQRLEWVTLDNWKIINIWNGEGMSNLIVDFNHKQLAFQANNCVMHYKLDMTVPVCIIGNVIDLPGNLKLGDFYKFSKAGDRLFISIDETNQTAAAQMEGAPAVWSYTDPKLQTVQERQSAQNSYLAIILINEHKLVQIQKYKNEIFWGDQYEDLVLSFYQNGEGDPMESWWNSTSQKRCDLINTKTGERQTLDFLSKSKINSVELSPDRKYVIYFDAIKNGYFSYDVVLKKICDLTKSIHALWKISEVDYEKINFEYAYRGIAAWLPNDQSVLVYDSHDIWKLDPAGKESPVNITNGYGLKHNIVFHLELNDQNKIIPKNEPLLLTAFNKDNKNNGFFTKDISKIDDPEQLTMGPYLYKLRSANLYSDFDFTPIKAGKIKMYLLKRQSATEAPNYFLTSNFKTFKKVTDIHPQKAYNWYTSELHTWKSLDGRKLQGILYKPENFDPNKKYPIIFYYYQKLSDGLNVFFNPNYSVGGIDFPTYISNGYLIFLPDIIYSMGDPMQGTYDAVVSAAKYCSTLPFIDSNKMGLQGHSFGGIQTSYLVTRTNLFAAACSASSVGDWISRYGTLSENRWGLSGYSLAGDYENQGQNRMEKSLWMNLAGYIKNSPVIYADLVTTPLLLMHTKMDAVCPFPNALEFFLGLRRLGKKSWMLVYSEGNHVVHGKESKDFTIRMQQFFDHYLMDKPAPLWMLDGVAAKDRSFEAGLKLDNTGRTPGPGLLIPEEQREVDSLMNRKYINITIR